ncbi:hypothetical protein K0M31_004529 [Melipona bicolor]|uniref:Uncharacterized protein n=1 Tax=Melipona bicolor TaxID=60889 RepID=A0AA40FWY8_9HYME|nr:hypothetical protein K0M31_004529 [Melipona bicolor]
MAFEHCPQWRFSGLEARESEIIGEIGETDGLFHGEDSTDLLVDLLSARHRLEEEANPRNGRRREDSCRRGYMKLYLSSRKCRGNNVVRRLPESTPGRLETGTRWRVVSRAC